MPRWGIPAYSLSKLDYSFQQLESNLVSVIFLPHDRSRNWGHAQNVMIVNDIFASSEGHMAARLCAVASEIVLVVRAEDPPDSLKSFLES